METDTFFNWKSYFHFVFGLYRLLAAYFYAWNITSISRVLGWLDRVGSQSTLGRLVCRPFPCWRIWERWTMFYCSAFFGCKNWYGMRYDSPFPANPIQAHISPFLSGKYLGWEDGYFREIPFANWPSDRNKIVLGWTFAIKYGKNIKNLELDKTSIINTI